MIDTGIISAAMRQSPRSALNYWREDNFIFSGSRPDFAKI